MSAELIKLYKENATPLNENHSPHFDICIKYTNWIRTFYKPQITLEIDGQRPFNPISADKLLPSLEWAMNWCVAAYETRSLLVHAGVVVKDGKAIVLPARSGSGKSTLSTYLSLNGWQLFSDEMAIIDLETKSVLPIYRPASIKNNSMDLLKSSITEGHTVSTTTENTHKGSITHIQTATFPQFNSFRPTPIHAFVLPLLDKSQSSYQIYEIEKAQIFNQLIKNAFNYNALGEDGFECLTHAVNAGLSLELTYYKLQETISAFDDILYA